MPKNIVICCDGTQNRRDDMVDGLSARSNVARIFDALEGPVDTGWRQIAWYDEGIGTGTSTASRKASAIKRFTEWAGAKMPGTLTALYAKFRMMLELATGVGITENIVQAYTGLVRHYEPGDRIFLFGFSRGAYTVRCLAGVIMRCGLLRAENIRFAPDIVRLYRYRDISKPGAVIADPSGLFHDRERVDIHFLGVWDTVASLGLPLCGWWFRIGRLWSNRAFGDNSTTQDIPAGPVAMRGRIRHALAMDERRAQFFVTLFDLAQPVPTIPDVKQVWFRGTHGGIGGGYTDTGLSDIALQWMMEEARLAGLLLDHGALESLTPSPLGAIQDELVKQAAWRMFPTWPRWHPCPRPSDAGADPRFGGLHQTVHDRARHATALRRAREQALASVPLPVGADELVFLDPGAPEVHFRARADQQWNRSGIVIEQGGLYEIKRTDTDSWWDKECPPCGAEGQSTGWFEFRRWVGGWRRCQDADWMELVVTVAHPRCWPLRELGGWKFLRYVLGRDPREVTEQLIPIGRYFPKKTRAIIAMEAPSGMLFSFANDAWLFTENNSGALNFAIRRIDGETVTPDATIHADGKVTRRRATAE